MIGELPYQEYKCDCSNNSSDTEINIFYNGKQYQSELKKWTISSDKFVTNNRSANDCFRKTIIPSIYESFFFKELPKWIKKQESIKIYHAICACPVLNVVNFGENRFLEEIRTLKKYYYTVFANIMLENKNILIENDKKGINSPESYVIIINILSILQNYDFSSQQAFLISEIENYLNRRNDIHILEPNLEKYNEEKMEKVVQEAPVLSFASKK